MGADKTMLLLSRVNQLRLLIAALLIIVWQSVASLPSVSKLIVASPMEVLRATTSIFLLTNSKVPNFYLHLQRTGYEVFIAYLLVIAVGLPLGIAFGASRRVADTYEPLLLAYLAFPTVVLFPLIFLIFGSGELSKIVYGVLIGFAYVAFNAASGVQQVEKGLVDLSRSLGHSRLSTIFKVVLPSAMPTIIGGFRLGFGFTFIGVMVGEIINGSVGLGYLLNWTALSFLTPELYAIIIISIGVGVAGDSVFRAAENRLMRWRY
ncbi:MAG: ABC transporter permease [Thaumarchaeota archaeon]|nr:ABC transporter permease [Nitrososphaerota archaeon]MCL5317863.1 ABC transporter permease [Nitrososphaerota archaeon]